MTRMERQVYVIMPAFQPEEGLAERVRELGQEIRARILVIDDGSGPEYEEIFAEAETIEGCLVLRHESNQGKGRALKTGFSFVRSRLSGAEEEKAGRRTLILCVDCDGQHFAPDGLRLLKKAAGYPGSLVLGVRSFSEDHVPLRSRAGNRAASWILQKRTGIRIHDTQTGFRAFDSSLLELMCQVPGERFDYETEVLFACARKKVPMLTEEIRTIYIDHNAGSHFRPVRDSLQVLAAFLRGGKQ